MRLAWFPTIRPCVPAAHSPRATAARPRLLLLLPRPSPRRTLLTLAIESSCDDTCVAVLQKPSPTSRSSDAARLLFHEKVTSDNRHFRGVHPLTAVVSHTAHLGPLVQAALRALPEAPAVPIGGYETWKRLLWVDGAVRLKPDFVTVTRGPGMTSNLATGLNTAKGLAAAWDVPLLGVNHMQAHALTPRLVAALARGGALEDARWRPEHGLATVAKRRMAAAVGGSGDVDHQDPQFPFLSLLVSGGHTLLVHSRSLTDHRILAEAKNIAIGDMLDKCARVIIPASQIAGVDNVMYGPLLEKFAFPDDAGQDYPAAYGYTAPPRRVDEIQVFDSGRGWTLTPPLSGTSALAYDFAGFNSQVQRVVEDRPDMGLEERRFLAQHAMRLAFEHLASRLLFVLRAEGGAAYEAVRTVVVAGGVASNRYLMHILRSMLAARGFGHLQINAPPPALCTDNAAMIAWTGMEMYEAGWRSKMDVLAMRKWPVDPRAEGGGIFGAEGWVNVKKM
ncbi:uncharacterized protein JN550_011982 [Neoarthrinium moseri]|uniref:uncharacterized protein n=1 Tax=Neoarthrinium moseri TaxID=1658444 RepID=UPI001FDD9AC9|nr:uncharacterized protein JN550_011982 [Neoarthrinium moseri]KAI1859574.1 hypothetical protein JN550_011982 [Neoarthrinium moseri]